MVLDNCHYVCPYVCPFRGAYCAISVAKLLDIDSTELFDKTPEWLLSCQTYEGGFGAAPGHEAHGGYTFCGVAALVLLNSLNKCNVKSLLKWVTNKQMRYEGGFAGRYVSVVTQFSKSIQRYICSELIS